MKKFFFVLLALTLALTLSSCGEEAKVDNEPNKELKKENKKEEAPKTGTITNPVPLGQTLPLEVKSYTTDGKEVKFKVSFTILGVERGESAYTKLAAENMFNGKAPDGFEWALVSVKGDVTDTDNENEKFSFDPYSFKAFDESKTEVAQQMAVVPDEFLGECFKGGSKTGNVALIVPVGQNFTVEYTEGFSSQFYFATK